jgi:hypothetical protein
MTTVICALAVASFISAVMSMAGKCPITVPVLLLSILELLRCLPLGH